MFQLLASSVLAAAPANAGPVAAPFDLAEMDRRTVTRERAVPGEPAVPRGTDLRAVAIDAPEVEVALLDHGPTLRLGALGGRSGGVPKLAHIAIGWRF